MNSTLLIIKPHASSSLILRERIRSMITDNGFTIVAEGIYDSRVLKKKRLLDMYFGDFASFGSSVPPSALTVDSHVKADFQRWSPNKDSWDAAVMEGRVLNGVDAIKYFGESATAWDLCAEARSSPHFIISSQISVYHLSSIDSGDNHKPLYVLNATYPYIRDSFLDKNNTTPWFEIEWPSSQLSWHDFKHEFVGSKDPQSAAANSIRGVVFRSWKTFELESEPDSLHNVVRVSAGPLQSLYERIKWFGITPAMDETLGRHLGKGMGSKYVDWALTNPFILHPTRGNRMFLFDQTRSMDAPECLEYLTVHGKGCWHSIVNGIGSPPAAPAVNQSTADRQAPPSSAHHKKQLLVQVLLQVYSEVCHLERWAGPKQQIWFNPCLNAGRRISLIWSLHRILLAFRCWMTHFSVLLCLTSCSLLHLSDLQLYCISLS
eukprot:PhF_6_TR2232/c0_g1_i1/m.3753